MKRHAYIMIAMVVLVGSLAVSARAQIGSRTQLANIPFEFSVNGKTLPAGEYLVRQINQESASVVLQVRSCDGHTGALIQMDSVTGKVQDSGKLIFHRYGNRYFFAQAWTPGRADGLEARKSRTERAAERELATLGSKPQTVALNVR